MGSLGTATSTLGEQAVTPIAATRTSIGGMLAVSFIITPRLYASFLLSEAKR